MWGEVPRHQRVGEQAAVATRLPREARQLPTTRRPRHPDQKADGAEMGNHRRRRLARDRSCSNPRGRYSLRGAGRVHQEKAGQEKQVLETLNSHKASCQREWPPGECRGFAPKRWRLTGPRSEYRTLSTRCDNRGTYFESQGDHHARSNHHSLRGQRKFRRKR